LKADRTEDGTIFYFCPDTHLPSAGIRRIYRHVALLAKHGFRAAVMHQSSDFLSADQPQVPLTHLDAQGFGTQDIVVIPEGHPQIMQRLASSACRKFALVLNWDYVFKTLPDGLDWRAFKIERVLVVSPIIGQMISWSMRLPFHLLDTSIDKKYFFHEPAAKEPLIVYIQRKADCIHPLRRLLATRNPGYVKEIIWCPLSDLTQAEYADQIRKASVFLNLSQAEGFPTSCLEAMQCGALVAGFDGVGGRSLLRHDINCLLAPNGDYLSLAYLLAPVLNDLLAGNMQPWQKFIARGMDTAAAFSTQAEEDSVIQFWQTVL
jgi:glycosyltransferase involved in cell wall biosynthesis